MMVVEMPGMVIGEARQCVVAQADRIAVPAQHSVDDALRDPLAGSFVSGRQRELLHDRNID